MKELGRGLLALEGGGGSEGGSCNNRFVLKPDVAIAKAVSIYFVGISGVFFWYFQGILRAFSRRPELQARGYFLLFFVVLCSRGFSERG